MKFIFVGGCGRSGTTLVQKILSSHSKIVGGPEFDHARDILNLYKRMRSPFFLNRQSFFYTQEILTTKFRSFYESLFQEAFLRKINAVYLSEKTPINIEVADILLEMFSDAVFINVIRDGRDVVISYLDVKKGLKEKYNNNRRDLTTIKICHLWNSRINKYLELQNNPNISKRLITVKYENLVTDTETTLQGLFKFLGLKLEEKLLHIEKLSEFENHSSKVIYSDVYNPEDMRGKGYTSQRIGRWEKGLGWGEKILANLFMAKNLVRLGYKVEPSYIKFNALIRSVRSIPRKLIKVRI